MKSKIVVMLVAMVLLLTSNIFAQPEQLKINDDYFPSVFAKIKSGKFSGTANGVLLLKNSERKNIILDFQGSQCDLALEKDDSEVYDVSWKHYTAQTTSGKSHVKYDTYGLGNELKIEYQKQFYTIGSLDGASDMVVDGLSYTYIAENETEFLILTAKKELKLSSRTQNGANEKEQFIWLQPNSVIVFAVKRKN